MLNKIILFFQIKQFYSIFGDEVGNNFITKLSDMTVDNVHDVLFDINEIHTAYETDCGIDTMEPWLRKLKHKTIRFCYKGVI